MNTLHSLTRVIVASTMACSAAAALGQQPAYPARPVRLVIPFSPGGATDVPGRILAQQLTEAFGQQFLVDNRPGAGSTIGAELVAKAPADGHTLLLTATTHVISASLYRKLPYDAINDFDPVMQVASGPNVLVVHPSLPAASTRQLIELAHKQPGRIDYASSGNGSSQHLFAALFTAMARVNMTHVPYKGSAQATSDLIGGQVSVGFPGIAIALPHARAGRLRPLGVTSERRSRMMPEIPTIAESGVPGYEATLWLALISPRGTPPHVIERLYQQTSRILRSADVQAKIVATGTEITIRGPEALAPFLAAELRKWGSVVQQVGATAN